MTSLIYLVSNLGLYAMVLVAAMNVISNEDITSCDDLKCIHQLNKAIATEEEPDVNHTAHHINHNVIISPK